MTSPLNEIPMDSIRFTVSSSLPLSEQEAQLYVCPSEYLRSVALMNEIALKLNSIYNELTQTHNAWAAKLNEHYDQTYPPDLWIQEFRRDLSTRLENNENIDQALAFCTPKEKALFKSILPTRFLLKAVSGELKKKHQKIVHLSSGQPFEVEVSGLFRDYFFLINKKQGIWNPETLKVSELISIQTLDKSHLTLSRQLDGETFQLSVDRKPDHFLFSHLSKKEQFKHMHPRAQMGQRSVEAFIKAPLHNHRFSHSENSFFRRTREIY